MSREKFVTVAIITKNEEKNISEAINSILTQNYPESRYELIIVEGNSSDNTLKIAKQFQKEDKRIRIFQEKGKPSQGNARNIAVEKARGEYLAFIDADCIAEKNWLRMLVKSLEEESKKDSWVAGVGGIMKPASSRDWKEILIGNVLCTFLGSGSWNKSRKQVSSISNYNAIYLRKILIHERYSAIKVGEDFELNRRLAKKGHKLILNPNIKVYHHQKPSFSSFAKQMFIYGKAQIKVYKKIRAIRPFAILAPTYLISLATFLILGLFSQTADLLFQILLVPYLLAILLSTLIITLRTKKMSSLFAVPLYPLQHISYSLGVLFGALYEKS